MSGIFISYLLSQQGSGIHIRMLPNTLGRDAEGRGVIAGRAISMDYAFQEPSIGYSVGRANVMVSADGASIQGSYVATASRLTLPFLLHK